MLSVNCKATGVINNMVVTLSKKAETTAVIVHKAPIKGHVFPLVILKAQKPMKLNAPVSDKMLTIIIILKSNTKVSISNQVIMSSNVGLSFNVARYRYKKHRIRKKIQLTVLLQQHIVL